MTHRILMTFVWILLALQITLVTTRNHNSHYVIIECDDGKYTLELRKGWLIVDKIGKKGKMYGDIQEAEWHRDYMNAWLKAGRPKDPNIFDDHSPDEGADCKWREVEE